MNKTKKRISGIIVLLSCVTPLFADITNRGRLDSSGPTDFSMSIIALIAIGVGGLFGYFFIKEGVKSGFKDKGFNKFGCLSILICILGLFILFSIFS